MHVDTTQIVESAPRTVNVRLLFGGSVGLQRQQQNQRTQTSQLKIEGKIGRKYRNIIVKQALCYDCMAKRVRQHNIFVAFNHRMRAASFLQHTLDSSSSLPFTNVEIRGFGPGWVLYDRRYAPHEIWQGGLHHFYRRSHDFYRHQSPDHSRYSGQLPPLDPSFQPS